MLVVLLFLYRAVLREKTTDEDLRADSAVGLVFSTSNSELRLSSGKVTGVSAQVAVWFHFSSLFLFVLSE